MGNQYILIPKKLQNSVLKDLHKDHMGTSHMKSINKLLFLVARSWQTDWRPSQIMLAVSSCEESTSCSSTSPLDLANKTLAEDPYSLCWSLHGKSFSSSGRCSFQMASTTPPNTTSVLHDLFASHGLPEQIVSDSDLQFTSEEFKQLTKGNSVRLTILLQ